MLRNIYGIVTTGMHNRAFHSGSRVNV